jgi:hypothetical protein
MAGAHRTNEICGRLVAKPERKSHLKDLCVNGRKQLQCEDDDWVHFRRHRGNWHGLIDNVMNC